MNDLRQVSVLLAEGHALLRGCLHYRLDAEPGLNVVAAVETVDEAIEQAIHHQPHVVLMSTQMLGQSPFDATRILSARCPGSRVIFMCDSPNDRHIQQAQKVRALGCIAKTETDDTVIEAILSVADGQEFFSPQIRKRIIFNHGYSGQPDEHVSLASTLSQREVELVRNVAAGLSQKEIARAMKISEHTVHRHTTNVMRKLRIHDRVELARFAIREGLAQP